jgi:hypothetical protein
MTLRSDHVAGGAFVIVGLIVLALSGDLPTGRLSMPGPGMMPKLVCTLMIFFGLVLVVRAGDSRPFAEIAWGDLRHAAAVLAITVLATALYTTLGFLIAMALLLFALLAFERQNLAAAALYSIGVSVATYALFTLVLKSPLERGLLWF